MAFLDDDFLLQSEPARRLYHDHAAGLPIYDYHCHLPPADLAADRTFDNLHACWLEGDHYKWRAMRADGVAERYCTGDADPWEKFLAWAKTVPATLRNPLYHWTHLELRRYFGIDVLLNEDTAKEVWDEANRQLKAMPVSAILQKFNVALIGTTDAPADDLHHHRELAGSDTLPDTAVYPAFRADKVHALGDSSAWNTTMDTLGDAADLNVAGLDDLLHALSKRHAYFHEAGSRLSDAGLTHLPAEAADHAAAAATFGRARGGGAVSAGEAAAFAGFVMLYLAELDHSAGWTHQLHLGAMRNNNAWALEHLGPDTGYDSIGDYPQAAGLRRHLGTLAGREKLPRTVLYNLNPADNYLFASMAGNYQGGPDAAPGHVQFGSGWWFLDQLEAMEWQINALSNLGLLSRFVGMLTDSRSFLSYPRHEYFRRLLCDLLGRDMASGRLPDDDAMIGRMVEDICFNNARDYFGMSLKGRFQ